jgi:hypothetical protein
MPKEFMCANIIDSQVTVGGGLGEYEFLQLPVARRPH